MEKVIIVDHCLENISFILQSGEFVGLLGKKDSGKTTLIKMLTGIISPRSGFISVLGFDPFRRHNDFLRQISAIFPKKNELWQNLPVIDSISVCKSIYKLSDKEYKKNLDELVTELKVTKLLNHQVNNLTAEQKIKFEFIVSLIHKPKILFLDEPFLGIDTKLKHFLTDILYDYAKKNLTTVLLTSDSVIDLIGLVRRVIVIENNKLIFDGPIEKIK